MLFEIARDGLRIGDMAVHAEGKRFESLQNEERIHRRDTGADIANRFRARLHQESVVTKRVEETQIVIGGGAANGRKTAEIKIPRIQNHARNRITVTTNKLRRRMQHNRRAMLDQVEAEMGVAKVLSMMSGILCDVAKPASFSKSRIEPRGTRRSFRRKARACFPGDRLFPRGKIVRIDQRPRMEA